MKSLMIHYRILYADFNEDARFMVTTMCELAEISVITANTVAEAWRLAQTECFDLYLLDSQFPDGSGLNLCSRLSDYTPHTPVIIYSGDASEVNVLNGLAAGANAYLTKPYFGDLNETIKRTIEQVKEIGAKSQIKFAETKNASPDYRNDAFLRLTNFLNY